MKLRPLAVIRGAWRHLADVYIEGPCAQLIVNGLKATLFYRIICSLLHMFRKYTLMRVYLGFHKKSCTALHETIGTNACLAQPGSHPVFRNNKNSVLSILRRANDYLNQRSQRSLNSACFNSRRSNFKLFISLNISVVILWRFVSDILYNDITRSLIINGMPAFVPNSCRCPPLWRHGVFFA